MNRPRRLLVFAYYFPPLGLSGVQRVAGFVKYLPEYGWVPVVLTAETRGYFAFDQSLRDEIDARGIEVHATRSTDPTRVFGGRVVPFPGELKRTAFSLVSSFFFVPDNKVGWSRPAAAAAAGLHASAPFDAVFATGPPYSALRAAALFASQAGLPLVSDFRDDWVGNPRHLYPTPLHRRAHERMEREVVAASRAIVAVNEVIASDLARRNPVAADRISALAQGYDPADFPEAATAATDVRERAVGRQLRLLYTGTFYDAQRPHAFAEALRRTIDRHPEWRSRVRAEFSGAISSGTIADIRARLPADLLVFHGYLDHRAACGLMMACDVLWMTVGRRRGAEQISTGKLFEYFGTLKPVLGLVPGGAARSALESYSAGFVAEPDDVAGIAEVLEQLIGRGLADELPTAARHEVMRYDRRLLTRDLAATLNAACES